MARILPSGLLIQDTTNRSLQQKIADCCQLYWRKFGKYPEMIWLHPDTLGGYVSPNGIRLEAALFCQPSYFLIGPLPRAA